jgi:AcrR family transcriptional regulator
VRQLIRRYAESAYHDAILEAAERVFVRLGYRRARMSDLAKEVGVATGTLYNYFVSKEKVFQSLIERRRAEFALALEQAARVEEPLPRVRAVVRAALTFIEHRGSLVTIFTQMGVLTESDIPRICGKATEDGYLTYLEMLAAGLRDAVAAGDVRRDLKVELLCAALAGSVNSSVFFWSRAGGSAKLAEKADQIVSLFLEGASVR